jgi:hypothetical protein
MNAYLTGEKDRETAVADYKKAENKMIISFSERLKEHGISFWLP